MRGRVDPLRIVEAAYTWHADERRWLDGIVDAAGDYDIGGGVIAYTATVGAHTRVESLSRSAGAGDDVARALRRVTESYAPSLARLVLAPSEFAGNTAYRLARLARLHGVAPETYLRRGRTRVPSSWVLLSGDPTERSLLLCYPAGGSTTPEDPFPHRDARNLGLVGAHLGAALRLRALVAPPEAILTPTGRVLHAEGVATRPAARESLARAVLSSERARGRLRRADAGEALGLWGALVDGRWTIVDAVERDGKRLLLARKNTLRAPHVVALTDVERDVVWLAAAGHSYKYIAYELGVPVATVSTRLRRALGKLRIPSRRELLARLAATGVREEK